MPNKDTLFTPSKAETKAESVTRIAREIIEAENSERTLKTQRLRAARLEKEAAEKAQPTPKAKTKAKAAPRRKPTPK